MSLLLLYCYSARQPPRHWHQFRNKFLCDSLIGTCDLNVTFILYVWHKGKNGFMLE